MKIIGENSAEDIKAVEARRRAEEAQHLAEQALRVLAANILRVTRGAGKPWTIVHEAHDFLDAIAALLRAQPTGPYEPFIETTLRMTRRDLSSFPRSEQERSDAEDTIIRGALQVTASRLLKQLMHERAGDSEIYRGVRDLDDAKRTAEAERAARHRPEAKQAFPKADRKPRA